MRLPSNLYKFSPLREEFFENRLVRITQRIELNDPYEFHPSNSDIAAFRKLIPPKSIGTYNISDKMIINNHFNCMGVMSFTESLDNFLMWSHYGDEHRGMAVEFDPQHDFFRDLRPVIYSDQKHKGSSITYSGESAYLRDGTFLEKSTQWETEKEWRIIDSLITSDCLIKRETGEKEWHPQRVDLFPWEKPGLYMKQIPAEAILSVTFGYRVEAQKIMKISSLIATRSEIKHIRKYCINLNHDEYKLDFFEV